MRWFAARGHIDGGDAEAVKALVEEIGHVGIALAAAGGAKDDADEARVSPRSGGCHDVEAGGVGVAGFEAVGAGVAGEEGLVGSDVCARRR